ncbi:chondroitinase family protein [Vibrio fluvialis]|uniref:chondroitinase family protein n=1 Tax=Vibrio fluvialis TaxID=676 RepID=UPI001E517E27|nr:chondroitinase family protein [Vibrio fluvialis]
MAVSSLHYKDGRQSLSWQFSPKSQLTFHQPSEFIFIKKRARSSDSALLFHSDTKVWFVIQP